MRVLLIYCLLAVNTFLCFTTAYAQCSPENTLNFTESVDRLLVYHDVGANVVPYTFECWVRDDSPEGDRSFNRIANLGEFTDFASSRIELGTENGELGIVLSTRVTSTGVNIRDGKWHHVAVVNAGTEILIYLDGTEVFSTPDDNGLRAVVIVGDWNGVDRGAQWVGPIDEIRIWNIARTAEEIMANKDCLYEGNEEGLRSYVRTNLGDAGGDNTQITTIPELTGNNRDAFVQSFTMSGDASNIVASDWTGLGCIPDELTCTEADLVFATDVELVFPNSDCCPTYSYTNNSGQLVNGIRITQLDGNAIDTTSFSSPIGLIIDDFDDNSVTLRLPDSLAFPDAPGEIFTFCFQQTEPPAANVATIVVAPLSGYDIDCRACLDTVVFDCVISAVTDISQQKSFQIAPNPANSQISINSLGDGRMLKFELRDMTGRVLEVSSTGNSINIDRLPPATYYLIITNASGLREVYPVIKQ